MSVYLVKPYNENRYLLEQPKYNPIDLVNQLENADAEQIKGIYNKLEEYDPDIKNSTAYLSYIESLDELSTTKLVPNTNKTEFDYNRDNFIEYINKNYIGNFND